MVSYYSPAYLAGLISLEGLLTWLRKLILLLDNGQPEGGQGIVVVATSVGMTLDNGIGTEVLQARAGRDKVLANAACIIHSGLQAVRWMGRSDSEGN